MKSSTSSFQSRDAANAADVLRVALAGPIMMCKVKGSEEIEVDIPWVR